MASISGNINSSFFSGIHKSIWKKLQHKGLTEAEVQFIITAGKLAPGQNVLDIMCGYGRHAIPLAKAGIEVTAIDNQEEYIKEILESKSNEMLPLHAESRDIIQYTPVNGFNAVICMGNSFSFFDPRQTKELIEKISTCLLPGGTLIINSWMIAEIAFLHFREKDWFYVDDYKYLLDYTYSFSPGRIESEQTIISPDGNIETKQAVDFIYSLDSLGSMLEEYGLIIENVFSTPKLKKFSLGDPQAYIVASKSIP